MDLADYLKDNKLKQRDFAAELGVSASYLNEIVRRVKLPTITLAAQIEAKTSGAVPIAVWVPEKYKFPPSEREKGAV